MDFLASIMSTDRKQLLLDNAKTYINANSFFFLHFLNDGTWLFIIEARRCKLKSGS